MGNTGNRMDTSKLRELNRKRIFSCIKDFGPLPRVEICERTGISKPTVTRLIEQMLKEGLMEETGSVESERGRHPINVDINASSRYCIGLNLTKNTLGAAVVDLKMNIIEKRLVSIRGIGYPKVLLAQIEAVVEDVLAAAGVDQQKILGIGVGVPGLVDQETGVIKDFALANQMRDLELASFLGNRFGFPVKVDNNCNTRMLGEYQYGYAKGCKNAMFVLNSEGVGSGIVVEGSLFQRINSIANGFGHICMDPFGLRCGCGGIGCIETICSTEQIEQRAYELLCSKEGVRLGELEPRPTIQEICNAADMGDVVFCGILLRAAGSMASGLVSMINLIGPEIIVLSGVMFDASDYYYKAVIAETQARVGRNSTFPKIVRRRVSDALYEIGAATLILQDIM